MLYGFALKNLKGTAMPQPENLDFARIAIHTDAESLTFKQLEILQINVGNRCNQSCTQQLPILTGSQCFSCTAGSGPSCQGSLVNN